MYDLHTGVNKARIAILYLDTAWIFYLYTSFFQLSPSDDVQGVEIALISTACVNNTENVLAISARNGGDSITYVNRPTDMSPALDIVIEVCR